MKISVVLPIYLPSEAHKVMTDKNLYLAKTLDDTEVEWVIVETCSKYYENEADLYIHEEVKTDPNKSINRGFTAATGDYVIFLANDVQVCQDWIKKMLACFDNTDCGIASLGNNEHRDKVKDVIEEGLYFTVCMLKKEDAWLDSWYSYIFDDTDLIFRLYTQGKKFYKNLSGHVEHKPHSTYGKYCGNAEEYERSREYFRNKYAQYKDDNFYKVMAGI